VQQHRGRRRRTQLLAVEQDRVAVRDLPRRIVRDLAVHLHAPGPDQPLDLAARAEAGGGDVPVEADRERGRARYALAWSGSSTIA
jgi:hypothetical protein